MERNIIYSVQLDLDVNETQDVQALKNKMSFYSSEVFFSLFDEILEKNQSPSNKNLHLRIDKLEIDLEHPDTDFDSRNFRLKIKQAFEKALQDALPQKLRMASSRDENQLDTGEVLNEEEHHLNTFLFFLKTGASPWWIMDSDEMNHLLEEAELIDLFMKEQKKLSQTIPPLISHHEVQNRLIFQFPDRVLLALFRILFSEQRSASQITNKQKHQEELVAMLAQLTRENRTVFWRIIVACFLELSEQKKLTYTDKFPLLKKIHTEQSPELVSEKNMQEWLSSIVLIIENQTNLPLNLIKDLSLYIDEQNSENERKPEQQVSDQKNKNPLLNEKKTENELEETSFLKRGKNKTDKKSSELLSEINEELILNSRGIIVENAGLVLLNPFLQFLFQKTGVLDESGHITNKTLAAHILHYAATGRTNAYEHALLFEKYLVNIPLNLPMEKEVELGENILEEVHNMLNTFEKKWNTTGNSSIELIRNEFLQRRGKLKIEADSHRLIVEHKVHDILLNTLPWTISIIRLPWKKNILYTDWLT